MNVSLGNTLSALEAFGTEMGVTANNIANVETKGFKKSSAFLMEGRNGDIVVETDRMESEAPDAVTMRKAQRKAEALSNVDLAEEIPSLIIAERGYEANLKALRTQEEVTGTLIDMIG